MTPLAAWCLRIAGASGIVNGLGFGGFAIPAIVSVGQGHGIIYIFGNPTYGNGPFERIGVPTTVPLLRFGTSYRDPAQAALCDLRCARDSRREPRAHRRRRRQQHQG